jgi:uncharacterized membrane protein
MIKNMIIFGLGALLLGSVGLIVGDFALQWQPVPAALPLRTPLAYLSAVSLLLAGGAIFFTKTARSAALSLGLFYALWVLFLHVPRVVAHPSDLSVWLGVAEIAALSAGGLAAWSLLELDLSRRRMFLRIVVATFGACAIIFGASHFVYAAFTATMIPSWLPWPLAWAYITGAGHVAAGLSLLTGIAARLASTLLAAMFACFVLLLHLPRVLGQPNSRVEWTMLGIALSLTGAAWIIRTGVRSVDPAFNSQRQAHERQVAGATE